MTKHLCTRFGFALLFFCTFSFAEAQIWTEDFSYPDGTTVGTGNRWTSACGACAAGDFFEVRSGAFEANDVNDFSTWESEQINISSCPSGVFFQLDAIEDGDHEGPGCACTVNIDYFDVYYSVDGGPFTVIENWNNDGEVGHTLTGDTQNGVFTDADWGSTTVIQSGLIGNTLQLRVVMRNTSGTERLILDNVLVDCPLPVEWGYFEGEEVNGNAELAWSVLSENDNRGFEVERSADGAKFEALGFVEANGNGKGEYAFTDQSPLSGKSYYRIKQLDYSGAYAFSEVVEFFSSYQSLVVAPPSPNPASTTLAFALQSAESQAVTISLTDLEGRRVLEQSLEMEREARDVSLNTSDLPRGLYYLQVRGASITEGFRVVLQ